MSATTTYSIFWIIPIAFFTLMFIATLPHFMAEPYPRIVVGVTMDTGSNVITLLAPAVLRLSIIVGVVFAIIYGITLFLSPSGSKQFLARFAATDE